jgi:hypothetical protein
MDGWMDGSIAGYMDININRYIYMGVDRSKKTNTRSTVSYNWYIGFDKHVT